MGYRRKSIDERFWGKVDKNGPVLRPALGACWVWTGAVNAHGYGSASKPGVRSRSVIASRLSWELHNGPIPDGLQVLHKCDNPPCVRPDHLFLGTNLDNVRDKQAKGRAVATFGNARLTADQVAQIRSLLAAGVYQKDIGAQFGVYQTLISKIKNGKAWKGVGE